MVTVALRGRPYAGGISKVEAPQARIFVLLSTSFELPGNPGGRLPLVMPTSQILQHLYSFNTFSPEFSHCLDRLIQSDEEDHYLLCLQGSESTRLVDFLDRVRAFPSASFLPAYKKDPTGPRDHPCN